MRNIFPQENSFLPDRLHSTQIVYSEFTSPPVAHSQKDGVCSEVCESSSGYTRNCSEIVKLVCHYEKQRNGWLGYDLIIKLSSRWCVIENLKKKIKNRECSNLVFFTASHLLISLSVHLNFVPLTLEDAS